MLLDSAWTFGTDKLPAPQATLMKMVTEGVMEGNLPWNLVFIGVFLAIGLEILRIPVMPFAIGLYLPIYLNASIMIGGVVRMFVDGRKNVDDKKKEEYKEVIALLRKGYSIRNIAKLQSIGISTVQRIKNQFIKP